MKSFLEQTAEYIIEKYGDRLGKTAVLFPNRRAALFLKRHLAAKLQKTVWSPAFYSIEDFVFQLSGLTPADPLVLQLELYKAYLQVKNDVDTGFDEFTGWSNQLLSDFNDIDLYLVNAAGLFGNLTEAKAMSLWNADGSPLTDFQKQYLAFFSSLKDIYTVFNFALKEKKTAYKGAAYRYVAENIDGICGELEWEKIIFVGFNALSKAEEKIFYGLEKCGKGDWIWDADNYYLDDRFQEAGFFLRKYLTGKSKDEYKWVGDYFSSEKEIEIIGVPDNYGQAKVAGTILNSLAKESAVNENTAVVLNDEALLLPVLNSIPKVIEQFNLTMGFPLKQTLLFNLVQLVFVLNENSLKYDKTAGKSLKIYFRDILSISGHPYIKKLSGYYSGNSSVDEVVDRIRKSNRIFYTAGDLENILGQGEDEFYSFLKSLLTPWIDDPGKALLVLNGLVSFATSVLTEKSQNRDKEAVELEYLFVFSKVLNRISELLKTYPYVNSAGVLKKLIVRVAGNFTVPFSGEPLQGLQVMGMLETRTLDFDNIIMLSVNDGIIPSERVQNSFIPLDLRRVSGLPTYKENNAVYAYHFYRLLQRAKKVFLIYCTESNTMGGGEKSRFISQIETELPEYNRSVIITEKMVADTPGKDINSSTEIEKSSEVMGLIEKFLYDGVSPSALNVYIRCPLRFYFQFIIRLGETEEPEETIEARTLGKVVHDVLHQMYYPFIGKNILAKDIEKMIPEVENMVTKSFDKHYENGDINYGINHLIFKVAVSFTGNFLKSETEALKLLAENGGKMFIRGLEQRFTSKIKIKLPDSDRDEITVNLKGDIDRIDEVNGKIRVIDYKTGFVNGRDLFLKDWELLITDVKYDKVLQLLYYAWLYSEKNQVATMEPGIFSFRQLAKGFMNIKLPGAVPVTSANLNEFVEIIKSVLLEILDKDEPFKQTPDTENCKYCPFSTICGR